MARVLVALILLAVALAVGGYWTAHRWFLTGTVPWLEPSASSSASTLRVTVERGSGVGAIANQLQRAGLLEWPRIWRLWVRAKGADADLKAGEYDLPTDATPARILELLRAGAVVQHRLIIVEGTTVLELQRQLLEAPGLRQELAPGTDLLTLIDDLDYASPAAEGWFFPDTYRYQAGDSDRTLLRQAHERMRRVLDEVWRNRDDELPYETPYELLIMASVVEKETGRAADRAQIAQVFVDRLRQGMRLQTDPTVIYGLGLDFDGDLTRQHLQQDTPYNTYTRHGLPPTPIALPGRASLAAAAHPAPGDFLYFVARGDGTSQFSRTLDEHNAAVRRFQLGTGAIEQPARQSIRQTRSAPGSSRQRGRQR